ncbi:MAG: hypothetical protein ACI33K_14515 [Clostridiaceae bacterium]
MVIFLTVLGFIMIAFALLGPGFWGWYYSIVFFALGILYFCLGRVYSLLKEIKERLDKLNEDK